MGEGSEGRGREWMSRGRESSWKGEQWIVVKEKEGENSNEKTMMVKLIVQKENTNKN
jgi:hypothetical protein